MSSLADSVLADAILFLPAHHYNEGKGILKSTETSNRKTIY